jgi:hypothetical protein
MLHFTTELLDDPEIDAVYNPVSIVRAVGCS